MSRVHQILIEFDGQQVRVKANVPNAIICFGMMRMADLELQERLQGPEEDKRIISLGDGPLPNVRP